MHSYRVQRADSEFESPKGKARELTKNGLVKVASQNAKFDPQNTDLKEAAEY